MEFIINQEWLKDVEKANNKALIEAGTFIENKLVKAMPIDTGDLKRSITTNWITKDTIQIGSNKIQAAIMEDGREPWKMPNLNALVGWTIRRFWLEGLKTRSYDKQPYKTKWIIFIVARKIRDEGIRPRHLFTKIWQIYWKKAEQIYLYYIKNHV